MGLSVRVLSRCLLRAATKTRSDKSAEPRLLLRLHSALRPSNAVCPAPGDLCVIIAGPDRSELANDYCRVDCANYASFASLYRPPLTSSIIRKR